MSERRPADEPTPPQTSEERERRASTERLELLAHVQALLEPLMVALGLVFLVLLLLDFSGALAGQREGLWLSRSLTAIWVVFLAEFALRFVIAPKKLDFLLRNWLGLASLALPFLRPFRALRAVRAVRSLSLVRLLGGVNRAIRLLRTVARGSQIAYLAALTIFVMLAGATGAWYFERGVEGAAIRSFSDALWWSSALVTTINNEKYVVSPEARVVAILMRVYAVSVFGFITATIASFLLGRNAAQDAAPTPPVHDELAALRAEIAQLRAALAARESLPPARDREAVALDDD